ncbi:MAG TPA: hypothetical protein VFH91_06695 [Pyrinomonadaceae bacterium]|nr:hypothetical protein [Pyrinomonadaceae bacterium]
MITHRKQERGGAQLKFLIVMTFIGATAYAGYMYVPIAYQAYAQKDFMQHCVDVAVTQGYREQWVIDQLKKNAVEYNIPEDAQVTAVLRDNRVELTVQYIKPIEFPGYTYNYEFDQTARSAAFLSIK